MGKIIEQSLTLGKELKNFAYRLTHDSEDANDLYQDTYLKILQNEDSFQHDTNLKAWCHTIMKNTFINTYRRKHCLSVQIEQLPDLTFLENSVSDPADLADVHYTVKEISKHISDISDEQRLPFELYVEGYKYEEIAEKLNLPLGTVKSRIFFTRKKLQKKLME